MPHFRTADGVPQAFFGIISECVPGASRLYVEGGKAGQLEELKPFVRDEDFAPPRGTLWPRESRLVLEFTPQLANELDSTLSRMDAFEFASHIHVYSESGHPLLHWWDWGGADLEVTDHVTPPDLGRLTDRLAGEWRQERSPRQTLRGEVTNRTWVLLTSLGLLVLGVPALVAAVTGGEVRWVGLIALAFGVGGVADLVRRWADI